MVNLLTGMRGMAFSLLPLSLLLLFSCLALVSGSPGFRVDKIPEGLLVSQVIRPLNPVRKGDLIVAVDGIPYDRLLAALVTGPRGLQPPATITLLRGGERIRLGLRLAPLPPAACLAIAWPHMLLITVFLLLAGIALFRAPPGQPVHLFALMLFGFATSIASTLVSHFSLLQPVAVSLSFFVLMVSNWIAFGAWAHFICRFPPERDLLRTRRWPVPLFYLLPLVLSVTVGLYEAGPSPAFWGWMQRLRNLFVPLIIVGAFGKHLVDYLRLSSSLARNQLKLPLAAYWLSFGPYLFLYLLPNLVVGHPFIPFRWVLISGLALPMAYMVALLRYRLLGVDRLISRVLAHIILVIALTLLYSVFLVEIKRWFWGREVVSEELFLLFLILVALLFNPLARRVQAVIDRVLFHHRSDDSYLLAGFSRKMASSLHMEQLARVLTEELADGFRLSRAALLTIDENGCRLYPGDAAMGERDWEKGRLLHRLGHGDPCLFTLAAGDDPELQPELAEIRRAGYSLVLGLRGSAQLVGVLLLGARRDGHLFSDQDLRTFSTLANQAAIALENAMRYESLEASKRDMQELFAKVVQSEKLAALGEMTAVLAHELKNPLAIIRSSAQYLAGGDRPAPVREEMLGYIIEEVDDLNRVVSNLLGLARFRPPLFGPVDLERELPALVDRWLRSEGHNPAVTIRVTLDGAIPTLYADGKQLEQVFHNLLANGEEAMPDGGAIEIRVRGRARDVEITIRDHGPGISGRDLDKVFRKFFTTREQGLGLGLPVCRQIVRAHNGEISLDNATGGGAVVTLRLPCHPLGHA